MKRILVTIPLRDEQKEAFQKAAPDCSFEFTTAANITEEMVADKEIILGNIPLELVPFAKKLEWLQLNNAGTDGFCDGILPEGCILTNATGTYGLAISEHVVGMLLAIIKKLYLYNDNQKEGLWQDEGHVRSIYGANVLILGFGDIGEKTARLLHAFGAHVRGVRRTAAEKPDFLEELVTTEETDRLLPWADYIVLAMPGTPATKGFIDKRRLSLMKNDAVIINIGRGILIETEALADALENGELGAAGLDVTDPEPLPQGHRLYHTKNCFITPHISGQYHLPQTLELISELFLRNLSAYMAKKPLESVIDFKTGYRIP